MNPFGFDEQAVMFDITPVENQFILDYMLGANGNYVKVYLYGLMQCYYPQTETDLKKMADELGQTEEDVLKAFRYWERRQLVRRVSDQPPAFRYVNVKQRSMMSPTMVNDPNYESFADSVYTLFGSSRAIHGKEMSQFYEWVEDLKLPPEVVLLLIQHMISIKGANFSIRSAEKVAAYLAENGGRTAEDAEQLLGMERSIWDGSRLILRRLGKRRNPSEDEMALYRKWLKEWGYTQDAIEAACAETTKGEPTFAYLDGILRGMRQRNGKAVTSEKEMQKLREAEQAAAAPLKELLRVLGLRNVSINEGTLSVYREMRVMYPDDVILLAGKECAARGGKLDDVSALLGSWERRNLRSMDDVQAHLARVRQLDTQLLRLYDVWGLQTRPTVSDRTLLEKWLSTLSLGMDYIVFCAAYAAGAARPMPYLDAILTDYAARGIVTPEAAAQDRVAKANAPAQTKPSAAKSVPAQQYEQREYEVSSSLPEWMKEELNQLNHDA